MAENSHQLAAIVFADVVGYSAMMQKDEMDAVEKINRFRHSLEAIADELEGKIIQYYGDGSLLLFRSATDAAEFAKLLQTDLHEDPAVPVRIGVHMGDVLLHEGNVFGDVVNIASRIQALAPSGGIYVSEMVSLNITNKTGLETVFVLEQELKNIKDPVRIFELLTPFSKPVVPKIAAVKAAARIIPENSIAVLPFANMSSDQQQEYFSDGLTEDIITQLSKIKSLKVISRTSVMQYKNNPKPVTEISKELGVAFILEGSVQRNGQQVRITAQLINAKTDEHRWAESYDRPVDDIFTIQREVSLSIAGILNTQLSQKETSNLSDKPTQDMQAYDLYLRGKFLVEKRNRTDLLIARELFQQAVNKDPNFAIAYAGLANTYLLASYRGYQDPGIMLMVAKKHIDTSLGLDAYSGEIQATLGYWHYQTFNWGEAEKIYRTSVALDPNQSNVYLWLGILLEAKGEKDEAMRMYNQGSEINTSWDYLIQNKIAALAANNEQEEAIRLQNELIGRTAYDPVTQKQRYTSLSRLFWYFGRKEEAITAAEKAENPGLLKFYRDKDQSMLVAEVDEYYRVMKKSGEYVSDLWMGMDYAKAGAAEKALECFNKAIVLKDTAISQLLTRHYEFLNVKFISLIPLIRKVKALITY
jgi:TolB-like protein/class 3 adenylate cyclase/tetratricopeptide (TPR) repeat protein